MFKQAWNLVCKVTLAAGLFLLFFVGIELFRAFVFFYRLHHIAGWVFLAILLGGGLWMLVAFLRLWRAHPKALTPPPLPVPIHEADHKSLVRYCRYLTHYLERLSENQHLSREERRIAEDGMLDIEDVLVDRPQKDDLVRAIENAEQRDITPLLKSLSEKAEAEVRHSVRDVMLGVTLSPYHSMDIFVVIYRNAAMVLRIVGIYANRPVGREQLLILRDTFRVVATVNILNLGKTLIESLFAQVPIIGRAIDDIGQGLGAGLLTSASGHAAIARCAAFRHWDKDEAATNLAGQAVRFFADVRDLFTKDVMPGLKNRIKATTEPGRLEEPAFWDNVNKGITVAVDSTAKTLGTFVLKPAVAAGTGVARAGSSVTRGVARAGTSVAKATVRSSHKTYKGVGRALHTFGQRVKYTFTSSKVRRR